MAKRRISKRKITTKRKSVSRRKPGQKKPRSTKAPLIKKKEVLQAGEIVVEKMKFSTVETPKAGVGAKQELPSEYGQDRIVLQVRDPRWIHTYWEVGSKTYRRLKNELKQDYYKAKRVLRVYDVSHIIFNGRNAHRYFDIEINEHADNWYIDTVGAGRSWCVDLGLRLADGRFITIVRSNTVTTPPEGPSWITDEEWMVPEDMFSRLYGMGFGLGRSSPAGKAKIVSSPGIPSVKKKTHN